MLYKKLRGDILISEFWDAGKITLDYLLHHEFKKTGLESEKETFDRMSARFSKEGLKNLPRKDEEKYKELNVKVSDLVYERCEGYKNLYVKTNINPESLRKTIRGSTKRKITREMLAKFVIGIGLTVEEANKLFSLQSYPLDGSNVLLDAVVLHCLQNQLDISGFFETCGQVGLDIIPS